MNKSITTSASVANEIDIGESTLEKAYGGNSSHLEKRSARPEAKSVDDNAEESDVTLDSTGTNPAAKKKNLPEQDKKAEGASKSTSEKQSKSRSVVNSTYSQPSTFFGGPITQTGSKTAIELEEQKKNTVIAIEIFVRTLRINTDLFNGSNSKNDYNKFLKLLLSTKNKETYLGDLLDSKTSKSRVAIDQIPQFFFQEIVFKKNNDIIGDFEFDELILLFNEKSQTNENCRVTKLAVEKELIKYAGLVRWNDVYQGIPICFLVKYYKHDRLIPGQLNIANLRVNCMADTGMSLMDYLAFKVALREAHDAEELLYSEDSNSEGVEIQKKLTSEVVLTLYSLCHFYDIQQILESYKDTWLDEEFKKQEKISKKSIEKSNAAFVSKVGSYDKSRYQRLKECQSILDDVNRTNELSTALKLVEHRLQQLHYKQKSRLKDELSAKIQAVRREVYYQLNEGTLVIYNSKYPNLSYLAEKTEQQEEKNRQYEKSIKQKKIENTRLRDERHELCAKNERLESDNQDKDTEIERLEGDNQDKHTEIERLKVDNQELQSEMQRLESEKEELQRTIERLQREADRPNRELQRSMRGHGMGGESTDLEQDSFESFPEEDENPPNHEEKQSWFKNVF